MYDYVQERERIVRERDEDYQEGQRRAKFGSGYANSYTPKHPDAYEAGYKNRMQDYADKDRFDRMTGSRF